MNVFLVLDVKFRLSRPRVIDLALSPKELTEMESGKRQNISASAPCVWANYTSFKFQSPPFPFSVKKKKKKFNFLGTNK